MDKMITAKEFISNRGDEESYAWKNFKPCCSECRETNEDVINYYSHMKKLLESVEGILEIPRRLVERDYWYQKVYVNDYYFTMPNDGNYYVVQTNIRMNKYFSGKYHWYSDCYNARAYYISKSDVANIKDLFVNTYPVYENGNLYGEWNCDSDDDQFIPYNLDDEKELPNGKFEDYINYIDKAPYSNLDFEEEIPSGATMIKIPNCWSDDNTIFQHLAYILSHIPYRCFSNNR
jgi:hypothetical protein